MSSSEEKVLIDGGGIVKEGTAGFGSSTVNLLKSIMGSGMLALPAAIASVGAIPGVLLLAIAALLSGTGLQLLALASDRVIKNGSGPSREANFATLSKPTYPKAALIFEIAVALKCILVAASYLTVVRDVMPAIISSLFPSANQLFLSPLLWVSITVVLIAPVTFMQRMDSLKYTSFLGLIGIAYLFILSMVLFFGYNNSIAESFSNIRLFVPFSFSSVSNFSVFVFALTCHQNIFPIYNEIKDNRTSIMLRLISICLFSSFGIYTIFALSFYGVFGGKVETNVIVNLPKDGWSYLLARILYALLMLFSYPLQTFPARSSLIKLIGNFRGESSPSSSHGQTLLHVLVTLLILSITWLIASLKVPLGFILRLVGCTAGPVICYFLPAMFWWKLDCAGQPMSIGKVAVLSLFIFGIAATIIPLVTLILPYIFKLPSS